MSLTAQLTKLTEIKVLLTEVSRGKKKALIEKISENLFKDFGFLETHQRVVDLLNTQPRLVEEISKKVESGRKYALEDVINWMRDDVHEMFPEFTFEIPDKYKGTPEETYGVVGLCASIVMFYKFEEIDPTGNMKYGNWLVDVVLNWATEHHKLGNMEKPPLILNNFLRGDRRFFEDLPKLGNYLEYYDEAKRKNELPDEYKDINQIKPESGVDESPIDMMRAITQEFRSIATGDYFKAVEANLEKGEDYEIIDELNKWMLYKPLTQKGASILGMNTEWCTTYGEHCVNPDYQSRTGIFDRYGDLAIMVNKKNPDVKFQKEMDGYQFMDKEDRQIDVGELREEYPELFDYLVENLMIDTPRWLKKDEDKGWYAEDIIDIISTFVEVDEASDDFVPNMLQGHGYQYFEFTGGSVDLKDTYLPKEVRQDKEIADMVRKKVIEIIGEAPDKFQESEYSLGYIREAGLDDLFTVIANVSIFEELENQIEIAISSAQERANENEAYDAIIDAFKEKWWVREMDWKNDRIYIEDEMVPDIIEWNHQTAYSEEDLLRATVVQPYYGWSGTVDPEEVKYQLEFRLSEI